MNKEQTIDIEKEVRDFYLEDYLHDMQDYHHLFYALVSVVRIKFTEKAPTLQVGIVDDNLILEINPKFFFSKTWTERLFLLSHEAMHIILQHLHYTKRYNESASNLAQDIVINQSLLCEFNFEEQDIPNLIKEIFIVRNIFSEEEIYIYNISERGSWYYYYELLMNLNKVQKYNKLMKPCGNIFHKIPQGKLNEIIEKILDKLSDDELEQLKDAVNGKSVKEEDSKEKKEGNFLYSNSEYSEAGKQSGGQIINILEKRKMTYNWKNVLKRAVKPIIEKEEILTDTFRKISRKNALLPVNLLLPNEEEDIRNNPKKHDIYFFLDVSSSCVNHAQVFFNFAKTIPQNLCRIHLYSFDTSIHKLEMSQNKVKGGGGTSFNILESFCANLDKYPNLIFVVTDGYGDEIKPLYPNRWHWFLTKHGVTTYISKESHIHKLGFA